VNTTRKGRKRFYQDVNVKSIAPPWECLGESIKDNGSSPTPPIDNPISAGVDGTNSSTGISLKKPTVQHMKYILSPSCEDDFKNFNWYCVTLDSRPIKTPLGVTLSVPSENLAMAIASEWNDQIEIISPTQMPLMTMVCTALDQMSVPSIREITIQQLLNYLKNDTTCYWADPTEDRVLYRDQTKRWNDLHSWVSSNDSGGFGVQPTTALGAGEGLIMSRMRKSSKYGKKQAGLPHSDEVLLQAEKFLKKCDGWTLTAMQAITMEAKSFLIGMAVIRGVTSLSSSGYLISGPFAVNTLKAVKASRVEEEFQIKSWGLVEGNHDYDRLNSSIHIHSACVLVSSIVTASSTLNSSNKDC